MNNLILATSLSLLSLSTFAVEAINHKDGSTTYGDWQIYSLPNSYIISTQAPGSGTKFLDIMFAPKLECVPVLTISNVNNTGERHSIIEVDIKTTLLIDNHKPYILLNGKQTFTIEHTELAYIVSGELIPTMAYGKIMSAQSDGDKKATNYSLKGSYAAILDAQLQCLK